MHRLDLRIPRLGRKFLGAHHGFLGLGGQFFKAEGHDFTLLSSVSKFVPEVPGRVARAVRPWTRFPVTNKAPEGATSCWLWPIAFAHQYNTSIPQIHRIVFDSMALQPRYQFLLKHLFSMVLFLIADVRNNCRHL